MRIIARCSDIGNNAGTSRDFGSYFSRNSASLSDATGVPGGPVEGRAGEDVGGDVRGVSGRLGGDGAARYPVPFTLASTSELRWAKKRMLKRN